MTNLLYSVHQTNDSTSTLYSGKGFHSNRSGTGEFTHKFNVAGSYYYSSDSIDPYGVIYMKGQIIVTHPKPKPVQITVNIGKYTTTYRATLPNPPIPSSNCHDGTQTSCQSPDNASYVFWECNTPIVTSIYPNIGPSSTLLTIRGRGLGTKACYSEVLIGSVPCMVESSSSDVIKCRVGTGLTAGKYIDYIKGLTIRKVMAGGRGGGGGRLRGSSVPPPQYLCNDQS